MNCLEQLVQTSQSIALEEIHKGHDLVYSEKDYWVMHNHSEGFQLCWHVAVVVLHHPMPGFMYPYKSTLHDISTGIHVQKSEDSPVIAEH